MSEARRFRLRVTYAIEGRLAMLSHLETARTLERMVRRAKLPFAVSNGFSPHMKIAFGGALPVGVSGTSEIFDLQLADYVAPAKVLAALQDASAPGITVTDCRYIENSAPAASVAYPVSVYVVRLSADAEGIQVPSAIEVVRKKKTKSISVADHLLDGVEAEGSTLTFSLAALPTGSLRPDVFVRACLDETYGEGSDERPHVLNIVRTDQRALDRC